MDREDESRKDFVAWLGRKPQGWTPSSPTDSPDEIRLVGPIGSQGTLEHAQAVAASHNEEEIATPVGAWAVVRRSARSYEIGSTVEREADAPPLVFG